MTDDQKSIVIIGGGIIGCTSAYYLTRHPSYDPSKHRITLLEATKIAGGASGKAGGLLALWAYPSSIVPLSYRLHKELADEHGGAERWGYRAVSCGQVDCVGRQLPEQSGNGTNASGTNANAAIGAQEKADDVSLQKNPPKSKARLGARGVPKDLDWVSSDSLRAYDEMGDPSTTAQVHPRQFTESMAALAQEKGLDIRTGASVTNIKYSGDAVEAVTYSDKSTGKEKTIIATDIILSAGPWTQRIYPDAPIGATRAHSVTIRPTRDVSAYALFTQIKLPPKFPNAASKGPNSGQIVSPEIYARPQSEVYACGEGDHVVDLPASSDEVEVDQGRCQDIIDFVSSISDELRDGQVTARQACYLPSVNGGNSPLVGPTGVKGLWMAAGHTCWGIQNGPGTGKLMSEFVFDGKAKSAKAQGLDPRNYL